MKFEFLAMSKATLHSIKKINIVKYLESNIFTTAILYFE